MNARRWLVVGALAIAALLASIATWPRDRVDAAGASVTPTNVEQASIESEGERTTVTEASYQDLGERVTVAPPREPDPVPPEATHSSEAYWLQGRVVVLAPDGVELEPGDGHLELIGWTENIGESVQAEITQGTWSVELPNSEALSHLTIGELSVGESRLAIESPAGRIRLPADGFLEIRARVPRRSVLRVLDRRDGSHLSDIALVSPRGFPDGDCVHPGTDSGARILARDVSSPVDLDEVVPAESRLGSRGLLVGVEGFAWALVTIDFELGGERVLELEPGGALEVLIDGLERSSHAQLRLRGTEGGKPLVVENLEAQENVLFEGLAPGVLHVSAEVGNWWDDPVVLGQTTVEVVAGAFVRTSLALAAPPVVQTADASGLVLLPKEWEVDRVHVTLEFMGTPLAGLEQHRMIDTRPIETDREGLVAFAWQLRDLQVGRYELGLHEPPFSIVIDVPAEGRDDYELEVPPPAELWVRVVDASTGELLVTDGLHWNPQRPEGVNGGGLESAVRDAATGLYRIRAPATVVDLGLTHLEYAPFHASIDLSSPAGEYEIRLERACGIIVSLMDGDTAVAFPDDWYGSLKARAGTSGRVVITHYEDMRRRFQVSEPGTYELELPKVSGYVQPQLQVIDVRAGEFTEHVVLLEREHW